MPDKEVHRIEECEECKESDLLWTRDIKEFIDSYIKEDVGIINDLISTDELGQIKDMLGTFNLDQIRILAISFKYAVAFAGAKSMRRSKVSNISEGGKEFDPSVN